MSRSNEPFFDYPHTARRQRELEDARRSLQSLMETERAVAISSQRNPESATAMTWQRLAAINAELDELQRISALLNRRGQPLNTGQVLIVVLFCILYLVLSMIFLIIAL